MTLDIKALAKQAGSSSCEADYFMSFSPAEIDKFVRLVREQAFTEARWAIEDANADRHIDLSDCVQIIEELK